MCSTSNSYMYTNTCARMLCLFSASFKSAYIVPLPFDLSVCLCVCVLYVYSAVADCQQYVNGLSAAVVACARVCVGVCA